uniref:Uncharacterized protein n=1 Tax=Cacopsylla melanoneura TaxID=428564 RepID=A0A8D8W6Y3_9HEMI
MSILSLSLISFPSLSFRTIISFLTFGFSFSFPPCSRASSSFLIFLPSSQSVSSFRMSLHSSLYTRVVPFTAVLFILLLLSIILFKLFGKFLQLKCSLLNNFSSSSTVSFIFLFSSFTVSMSPVFSIFPLVNFSISFISKPTFTRSLAFKSFFGFLCAKYCFLLFQSRTIPTGL